MLSVLDIFRVGIGPSSSHTVGPMRIAKRFVSSLDPHQVKPGSRLRIHLSGSLAFTGAGHGTPNAVVLGVLGVDPETFEPGRTSQLLARLSQQKSHNIEGLGTIKFDPDADIIFDYDRVPLLHPNEMTCRVVDENGALLVEDTFYSTGGGFIATENQLQSPAEDDLVAAVTPCPYAFASGEELLAICNEQNLTVADVILANENAKRDQSATERSLDRIVAVMMDCIGRGLHKEGILPGTLSVQRRAPALWRKLQSTPNANEPERLFDWLNVYAMAVNEENADGGQVVTAPTNGAAGILPALLKRYCVDQGRPAVDARKFLLTAGGIGLLYKQRASISGAEMGCQGEVGVACSMAAGALVALWGGSPLQVAQGAEIGMEHNLGLTCDPVGGLVQIPCIERNAVGAVKAVNAARLSLQSDAPMKVSLDQVIEAMRQTGLDMSSKYKETSQGGLAVNVVEC